jgi:hypothetical protein
MGASGHNAENCGCAVMRSVFLNHNLSGLDYSGNRVTLFQLQLFGAPSSDCAFDEVFAHTDDYMGHDIAQLNLFNFSTKFVSR